MNLTNHLVGRFVLVCGIAALGLVALLTLLDGGALAALPVSDRAAAGTVTITFQGLEEPPVASVVPFTVTAQATFTDTGTLLRYSISAEKDGEPLSAQTIYYPEADDPLDNPAQWSSFTTDGDGEALFGPSEGFSLETLPELVDGIATPFWARLGTGTYSLTVRLVEITGTVRGSEQGNFNVRPASLFSFTGLEGQIISGTVPFSVTARVTETAGISTTPPITTWLRYRAQVVRDGAPLANQVISYADGSFTTDVQGVAWFGPESGFRLADLPALATAGITTAFSSELVAGSYTLTVGLMDISEGYTASKAIGDSSIGFTITVPTSNLILRKRVTPTVDLDLEDTVTYTIALSNTGTAMAEQVRLTDTLPISISFAGFVEDSDAVIVMGNITWTGSLLSGEEISIIFTATVNDDRRLYGSTISNQVVMNTSNNEYHADSATFGVRSKFFVYLPLTLRNYSTVPVWTPLPPLPQPAGDGSAFVLNKNLYHAGGWTGNAARRIADVYTMELDSQLYSWMDSPRDLHSPRFGAGTAVTDSFAYMLGGYDGEYSNDVFYFDGVEWIVGRSLPNGIWSPAASLIGNHIYSVGGETATGLTSEVWFATFHTDGTLGAWESGQSLPLSLITTIAGTESCLFAVGGLDSHGPRSVIYKSRRGENGSMEPWTQSSIALKIPLALHDATIYQEHLYILGGETSGGVLNDRLYWIDIDPSTCELQGQWRSMLMPSGGIKRMSLAVGLKELYLIGGQTAEGYTNQVWKITLPDLN